MYYVSGGTRIFQTGGVPTPEFGAKTYYLAKIMLKNYQKMKEIGPGRGGTDRSCTFQDCCYCGSPMLFNLLLLTPYSEWSHAK